MSENRGCIVKLVLLFVAIFLASAIQAESVYPSSAKSLKSVELGDAVTLFLPGNGTEIIQWDFQSNAQVIWLTDGYESRIIPGNKTVYFRNGLMRIHVQESCTEPDQPQYCLQQSALNLYRIALSHDDYLRELHHTQA
jgi:hypothetical protein